MRAYSTLFIDECIETQPNIESPLLSNIELVTSSYPVDRSNKHSFFKPSVQDLIPDRFYIPIYDIYAADSKVEDHSNPSSTIYKYQQYEYEIESFSDSDLEDDSEVFHLINPIELKGSVVTAFECEFDYDKLKRNKKSMALEQIIIEDLEIIDFYV